jgi:mannosyl-oligosaccharide alpha-1,2-mannosidase
VVFNTEAHPFPRFQLSKLLTTGWQRKPRDKDGKLPPEAKQEVETRAEQPVPTKFETVEVKESSKETPVDQNAAAGQAKLQDTPAAGGLDPITGKEKDGGR